MNDRRSRRASLSADETEQKYCSDSKVLCPEAISPLSGQASGVGFADFRLIKETYQSEVSFKFSEIISYTHLFRYKQDSGVKN